MTRHNYLLAAPLVLAAVGLLACNRAEPEKSDKTKLAQASPADTGSATSPSDPIASGSGANGSNTGANSAQPVPAEGGPILPPTSPEANSAETSPSAISQPSNAQSDRGNLGQDVVQKPGVTIESVTSAGADAVKPEEEPADQARWADKGFVKLQLPDAVVTAAPLMAFLVDCDRAVQELALTKQNSKMTQDEFIGHAKRISGMKLLAGKRLRQAADATPAERKTAITAQVEALSQLSGLGDVQAAQTLQQVASELIASGDPQLAHQGQLVMLGFRVNQLEGGIVKDPQELVTEIDKLFASGEKTLVEFLTVQQCGAVMGQLGYHEAAAAVQQLLVREFRQSSNRDLSMRAWTLEVNNSPQLIAYHETCVAIYEGKETDESKIAVAAEALWTAFPSANTLAYMLQMIVDQEYRGRITAARELAQFVASRKAKVEASPFDQDMDNVLKGFSRRIELLGKPIQLEELEGIDGKPLDWASYRGKVVLVYFWASRHVPSLNLQTQIKELRRTVSGPAFEVIGINLDETLDMSNAERLDLLRGGYGRIVHSSNPNASSFKSAAAQAMGVTTVPNFVALIDKSGTVKAVHPDFNKLPEMIAELLK